MYSYNKRQAIHDRKGEKIMENVQGRHFSITDPKDVNTVIYEIIETDKKDLGEDVPKFTVEKLSRSSEIRGENFRRTYYIDKPKVNGNPLVFLSFGKQKVVVNTGMLINDEVKVTKKPLPLKFDSVKTDETPIYKEFFYTPNLKRPITIIDTETVEEVKPILFFDQETNEIKGKCKLKPNKSYFAFEISEN